MTTQQRWTRVPAGGQEGGGGAVGDVVVHIRRVAATTMITPIQRPPIQKPQKTFRQPAAAVVEFSRHQLPSVEVLVAAVVAGGEGEGRVVRRYVGEDVRRGARRGEDEGEVVVVAVSSQALMAPSKFKADDLSGDWQGRVEQQAIGAPHRTALDRAHLIPLSEMPIIPSLASCLLSRCLH